MFWEDTDDGRGDGEWGDWDGGRGPGKELGGRRGGAPSVGGEVIN